MQFTLKFKIISLVLGAALIPSLVMLALMLKLEKTIADKAGDELNVLAELNIGQIAQDAYGLCQTANDIIYNNLNDDLHLARQVLSKYGAAALAPETIAWQALDSDAQLAQQLLLPRFLIGTEWLGQHNDFAQKTPILDEITHLIKGPCTIFQRVNEQGDMLSIASTVATSSGQRAIGNYIAALNQDGRPNPVIASVLQGINYYGLFYINNHTPSLAIYEPINDSAGKLIGMLYVAEPEASLASLCQTIMNIQVGKTGYMAVLEGLGANRGRYIISKGGERDGELIWGEQDSRGSFFVQSMINHALQATAGECVYQRYFWRNPGEENARAKMSAIIYFAPWDWVIFSTSYEDDFYAAKRQIRASFSQSTVQAIGSGLLILILVAAAAFIMGRRMTRPLSLIISVVAKMTSGDVQGARAQLALYSRRSGSQHSRQTDEIASLVRAFEAMLASLDALLGQVQRGGAQVANSVMQISASARQLESTVAEQAASTQEVNATGREIASTAGSLAQTMNEVGQSAMQTATTAETGRANLTRMESAMHRLLEATTTVSSQLSVINDQAIKISSVITTINKISDQTNLLSLNAAIEAEKAGEYGKGFSVVARETNRLADQTVSATQDIERMVREMQASVTSGVMVMDKFSEEVRHSVKEAAAISDHMGQVIDQVKAITSSFDAVKEGMQNQSQSAQQISEAVSQLSATADQTRQSLHEFNQATEQLTQVVQGLKEKAARFAISTMSEKS